MAQHSKVQDLLRICIVYLVEIYDKSSIESISVQELRDVLDREEI
jgi:hypothetical protein